MKKLLFLFFLCSILNSLIAQHPCCSQPQTCAPETASYCKINCEQANCRFNRTYCTCRSDSDCHPSQRCIIRQGKGYCCTP